MDDSKQNNTPPQPNLNQRSLNELDDVIQEIMDRNPWFEKHIEEIIKKQTETK